MCVCVLSISKRKMLEEKWVGYLIVGLRLILKKKLGEPKSCEDEVRCRKSCLRSLP